MPYIPPQYAPRDDYRTVLPNTGTRGLVNNWVFDVVVYWQLVTPPRPLTSEAAWRRLRMPRDHAFSALSEATQPPSSVNAAGLVPPELASRVFACSLAESVDADTTATVALGEPLSPNPQGNVPSFIPPRYRPRPDWQERLESMGAEDGSWQADLAKYWRLRIGGASERDAWRQVAMSPANAKMALEPEDSEESGLIPCLPSNQETVARRVLARSVATNIEVGDIYRYLILQPPA